MPRAIALFSDSTGNLGEYFIRALVSQFPRDSFRLRVYSFIKDKEELIKIFQTLASQTPIIYHAMIFEPMKREIRDMARERGWLEYDITGGAMAFLERASGLQAQPNLEALHQLNQEYERRIAAINFTVEHDDGLSGASLGQADIVLLGVSRTSKTPTSIYLANKGYKVANVPYVKDSDLHERVKEFPRLRLVGLTIDPEKLFRIRQRRAEQDRMPPSDYLDLSSIKEEVRMAYLFFLDLGCPIIDVTHHAVEETAALVLRALQLR